MASARTFWAARRVRETFKRWKAYILARVLNADRLKVAEGWRASRLLLVSMATLSSYVHIRREKEIDNHVAWEHSARLRMRRFLDAWRCQAELERRVRAAGDIREARRRAAVLVAWSLEARKGSAAAQAAADYRRLRTSFNGMLCHWWPRHLSAVLLAARQRRQRLEALHGWRDVAWRLRAEAVALRARADALLCAAVWSEWRSMACGAQHPREGKLHRGSRPSCPAATTGPNGLTLLKVLRRSKPQASSEDANAGVSASPIRTPAMQRVLAAMG